MNQTLYDYTFALSVSHSQVGGAKAQDPTRVSIRERTFPVLSIRYWIGCSSRVYFPSGQ